MAFDGWLDTAHAFACGCVFSCLFKRISVACTATDANCLARWGRREDLAFSRHDACFSRHAWGRKHCGGCQCHCHWRCGRGVLDVALGSLCNASQIRRNSIGGLASKNRPQGRLFWGSGVLYSRLFSFASVAEACCCCSRHFCGFDGGGRLEYGVRDTSACRRGNIGTGRGHSHGV